MKGLPLLTEALRVHPAAAKPGSWRGFCPVRARCAAGWAVGEEAALVDGRGDAELIVKEKAGDHGFLARFRSGAEIAVVYGAPIARLVPEYAEGQVLRILNGVWKEKRAQLELKAWTEIFVIHREFQ